MNWFKIIKATAAVGLSQALAIWLEQANRGPVDMALVHQDINQMMSGADDPQTLNEAIQMGEMIYRSNSGNNGELTPAQADLVNTIRLRIQSPMVQEAPMSEPMGQFDGEMTGEQYV